jgi:hypothetical protein
MKYGLFPHDAEESGEDGFAFRIHLGLSTHNSAKNPSPHPSLLVFNLGQEGRRRGRGRKKGKKGKREEEGEEEEEERKGAI